MGITEPELSRDRIEAILKAVKSVEADLGLPLLMTILAIAQKPGLSINDLAEKLDAPQQSASRYVSILQGRYQLPGSRDQFGKHPHVSLEISPEDPRRRALYLTPYASARLTRFIRLLYGDEQA
jgi:DNA-binding MarR family transcriptional regulator